MCFVGCKFGGFSLVPSKLVRADSFSKGDDHSLSIFFPTNERGVGWGRISFSIINEYVLSHRI